MDEITGQNQPVSHLLSLTCASRPGEARGGPAFPALFTGAAGGLPAARLAGLSETPAVAVLMTAMALAPHGECW